MSISEPANSEANIDAEVNADGGSPSADEAEISVMVRETEQEVTLQRTVRFGRVIVTAIVLGAVVGALVATLFPVSEEAAYTLPQVAGFSALVGGVVGLVVGGALSLVLASIAKRGTGSGVAIQTDVQ